MQQPFSLQGRVALITGGGTGIGFDIAKCFLASGATVVITGRREEVLKEAVANLGAGAHYAVNDVADLSRTSMLVAEVSAKHGAIDILVNNASLLSAGVLLEDKTDEMLRRTLEIGVWGNWWAMQANACTQAAAATTKWPPTCACGCAARWT